MQFLEGLFEILDYKAQTPTMYGAVHWLILFLIAAATFVLCQYGKNLSDKGVRRVILIVAIIVIFMEIYKQVVYTFSVDGNTITAEYQWYSFPWQFCSTPMYVGLLAGLTKKGKFHDSLCAYLATYSIFAGASVMLYPVDIFIQTVGVNIQTSFCHGSMIVVGIYLLYSGHVKAEHKTILKAIPVFACAVGIAVILNEIAYRSGLLDEHTFNMFFVSPYCDPSLPVYSLVQAVVPFPWSLIIYIAGFSLAAYIILLIAIVIKRFFGSKKNREAAMVEYFDKEIVEV